MNQSKRLCLSSDKLLCVYMHFSDDSKLAKSINSYHFTILHFQLLSAEFSGFLAALLPAGTTLQN